MHDLIGFKDMFSVNPISFNTDRFGNSNEALDLSSGYTFLTPGYFFTTPQFSISLWIYTNGLMPPNSVILDFGNGNGNGNSFLDDIILYLVSNDLIGPNVQIYNSSTLVVNAESSLSLVAGQWHLFTVTYDGVTVSIYINGILTSSVQQSYSLPVIMRMNNYFGASSMNKYQYLYSTRIDDIRFYNISLTSNQILNIMNLDSSLNNRKSS